LNEESPLPKIVQEEAHAHRAQRLDEARARSTLAIAAVSVISSSSDCGGTPYCASFPARTARTRGSESVCPKG
jgi:hypothetical protein